MNPLIPPLSSVNVCAEFNQCSSRLQVLKRSGIRISEAEFDCYRILHSLFMGSKMELVETLREVAMVRQLALGNFYSIP